MSAVPTLPPATADASPRVGQAVPPSPDTRAGTKPVQQVVKVRRDYNSWVARETIEEYALRFTPRSFRKWSALRVANTAFGAASFLVLEAVGGTLLVDNPTDHLRVESRRRALPQSIAVSPRPILR